MAGIIYAFVFVIMRATKRYARPSLTSHTKLASSSSDPFPPSTGDSLNPETSKDARSNDAMDGISWHSPESRFQSSTAAGATAAGGQLEESGFESTTISDILKSKGKSADGSWLWCTTDDSVYNAVQSMTQHNVGALVVVKPGEEKSIAGIITERDYLRKIIVQGRSSKSTKVGDIMTEENKLVTVTPKTRVLQAMQLMTDKRIRHIPVIDDTGMLGMVSIGDVVRAVVTEHQQELNRLSAFIQGSY
ncbi:CBS domain-containing protein CBSX3 [Carex littledalei]|uniref:CBS domain-containing protein CBSX3 n=1 Tax=Carex littledalei TaxID=544730 RepID=A0A833V5W6_9POAL|nr:CBS domain-containing protein CBSX3 [Carex littledalei]